ncbi:MAG: dioxygenase [Candidatus Binataceae bacterium]|jgi:catechol 1,2-dioxygenase
MAADKLTEYTITEVVRSRIADVPNPRLKQVMQSLINHLHEFAREVQLTPAEWNAGIAFLTAAGHITDDKRQEFILLSDTLGLSALVDLMHHAGESDLTTESSLLGPFYRNGAPELELGADISNGTPGEPLTIRGRSLSSAGRTIPSAMVDVWQAAPNGLYDVQDAGQPEVNLRARLRTDAQGRFDFRTIKPASYPVPHDGPVGAMLGSLGRHPFRPAHIHFIVSAPGFETLTTALYIAGDKYLDSDAVFGSRPSLVVDYRHADGIGRPDAIEFDFVLADS